jgi:predicted metal-binding membrane protein
VIGTPATRARLEDASTGAPAEGEGAAAVAAAPRRARLPLAIPVAIAAAWGIAIAAQLSGWSSLLHHDTLIEGGVLPLWLAMVVFLVAWQSMIVAMMLPSSIPMIRLFSATSVQQRRRGEVMTAFLGGYAAVWTMFAGVAFLGDTALHRLADRTPWLLAHPQVIGGGILLLAGLFQFTDLKERCLTECRHPAAFLIPRYRRGPGAAFHIGWSHGLFCLGCCWALMLLMFAAGVAHLWWMAALTGLMVYEKVGKHGGQATPYIGVALLALAAGVFLQFPGWLPGLLAH